MVPDPPDGIRFPAPFSRFELTLQDACKLYQTDAKSPFKARLGDLLYQTGFRCLESHKRPVISLLLRCSPIFSGISTLPRNLRNWTRVAGSAAGVAANLTLVASTP